MLEKYHFRKKKVEELDRFMQHLLTGLTDPQRYRGLVRTGSHAGLILFIGFWMSRFFFPFTTIHTTPGFVLLGLFGRDWLLVLLGYYCFIWIVGRTYRSLWWLLTGLLVYYWLIYSVEFVSAQLVSDLLPLKKTYDTSIGWYYTNVVYYFKARSYWSLLVSYETALRLQSFVFSLVSLPLLIKATVEILRKLVSNTQLKQQNVQLELDFLRSQVNPHFLFNALNSVYAMAMGESPRASRLVLQLSEMMRYSLYETSEPYVLVNKELIFIRHYLVLEQLRSSGRVQITYHIDEDTEGQLVIAPFLLIPFVENAFKHGVHATHQRSWVRVILQLKQGQLHLEVANSKLVDGLPISERGIGLQNVRKRLDALYPGAYQLSVDNQPEQHTVKLTIFLVTGRKSNPFHDFS